MKVEKEFNKITIVRLISRYFGCSFVFCAYFLTGFSFSSIAQDPGDDAFMSAILDSVSISRIYETIEQLSGETSFIIEGRKDSISSRMSTAIEFPKSQRYLEDRLDNLGYQVELFPFVGKVTFWDVEFAPNQSDIGWIAGNDGNLYATRDGGQSWQVQHINQSFRLKRIYPVNSETVWAVGESGGILTSKNGLDWVEQQSPTREHLNSLSFVDGDHGWVCGINGTILHTSDGGLDWVIQHSDSGIHLNDIDFISEMEGWAVGDHGTVLYTSDAGETWSKRASVDKLRLYAVNFISANRGWVVGESGTVAFTDNGGQTWSLLLYNESEVPYVDIDFLDQQYGKMISMSGGVLETQDGGVTWAKVGKIDQFPVLGFDMVENGAIWTAGNGDVAMSIDGGINWEWKQQALPLQILNNISAIKSGNVYPNKYYILCAHYDSFSWTDGFIKAPGADDNASGTAAVLEAARVLKDFNFPYSIHFIFFAGEEQGLVGSHAYATNAATRNKEILGVINLDMIGYDGNHDQVNGIHMGNGQSSKVLGDAIKHTLIRWELPLKPIFYTNESSGASDHRPFWENGYPAVFLTQDLRNDINPQYHSVDDKIDFINQSYLHANARLATGTIASLASAFDPILNVPDDLSSSNAQQFKLYPVAPNPFDGSTTIKYDLRSPMQVSIKIHNIHGEPVKNLVHAYQQAGQYAIDWKLSNRPSGIYFLYIEAGDHIESRKLLHSH